MSPLALLVHHSCSMFAWGSSFLQLPSTVGLLQNGDIISSQPNNETGGVGGLAPSSLRETAAERCAHDSSLQHRDLGILSFKTDSFFATWGTKRCHPAS